MIVINNYPNGIIGENMRMQTKLTVAFALIGLISCTLVGTIGYSMIKRDFGNVARKNAFEQFSVEFSAYVKEYGGVEAALASEPFDTFIRRFYLFESKVGKGAAKNPSMTHRWLHPSFRHLVLDSNGIVLLSAGGYKIGTKAPEAIREQASPIRVDGKFVALAAPVDEKALSTVNESYLAAFQLSLLQGVLLALGFSVLFGLFLSRTMSSPVKGLTAALRQMQANKEERYKVEVTTSDEIGEISEVINDLNKELSEAQLELQELAIHDSLTSLYNRRYFNEQADQFYESSIRYEQPLSLMIGDLDHFKRINDNLSHEMGDLVLEKVAEIITATTRKSDVVARFGGEEFVVLFSNTNRTDAAVSCEHIRHAIESYNWQEYHPDLAVTISIGLSDDTSLGSVNDMLAEADRFLLQAKEQGRNRLVRKLD